MKNIRVYIFYRFLLKFTFSNSLLHTVCGGTYSENAGRIASPLYPDIYPVDIKCEYVIKPRDQDARVVIIEFQSFDLEADRKCTFDYLEVCSF